MPDPDLTGEWTGAMPKGPEFPTTHWSVVVRAGDASSAAARDALEKLCRLYWYPLYSFVRRQGHNAEDAQDLIQSFFAQFLEKESVKRADQARGRFRTFLLHSVKHFLVSEWRKGQAAKRGSGGPMLSLDQAAAEQRYQAEPSDELSPDKIFDQRWAAALLEQVLKRLADEYAAQGKGGLFVTLKDALWRAQDAGRYADAAAQLGVSQGALKVAVHRLRHRYLELLRAEVADTLADPTQVEDELRYLRQVISQ